MFEERNAFRALRYLLWWLVLFISVLWLPIPATLKLLSGIALLFGMPVYLSLIVDKGIARLSEQEIQQEHMRVKPKTPLFNPYSHIHYYINTDGDVCLWIDEDAQINDLYGDRDERLSV